MVSGKVGISSTGLTKPFGLLSLRQLTVQNRSTIVVKSKFLVACSCWHVAFWIFFCGCRGFCHMTESDLFPFLLQLYPCTTGYPQRNKINIHLRHISHSKHIFVKISTWKSKNIKKTLNSLECFVFNHINVLPSDPTYDVIFKCGHNSFTADECPENGLYTYKWWSCLSIGKVFLRLS